MKEGAEREIMAVHGVMGPGVELIDKSAANGEPGALNKRYPYHAR